VTGRSVDACLIALEAGSPGVAFARPARVQGPVLSRAFPLGTRLSAQEYAGCRIGSTAGLPRLPAHFVAFSPRPSSIRHGSGE
jgi:hypothetical protein